MCTNILAHFWSLENGRIWKGGQLKPYKGASPTLSSNHTLIEFDLGLVMEEFLDWSVRCS